jgi:hypothetical protein
MCLTAIASISATGDLLPMYVMAKNRTERCTGRFPSHSEKVIKKGRLRKLHAHVWNSSIAKCLERFYSCGTYLQHIEAQLLSNRHEHSEFVYNSH